MRTKQLRRRLISAVTVAAVVAAGAVPGVAHAAGGPNLAQGKPVTASGVNGPYVAANVNDGNANSYWESPNNAFPQWIQVDLTAAVAIDQAKLKLPPAAAWATRTETIALQGSTNGSTWFNLSGAQGRVFNPATGNTVTIDFTAVTVRYVRATVTGNTGWPAAQLSELEIYGVAGQPDPAPDPDPSDEDRDRR